MSKYVKEMELSELKKYIDDLISELRKELGEALRKVENYRAQSELESKLLQLLGLKEETLEETIKEVKMNGLTIYINPGSEVLVKIYEGIAEKVQKKINTLSKIRRNLESLERSVPGISVITVFEDEIPVAIVFKA